MASAGTVAASELQESICRHAKYSLGKPWGDLSRYEQFTAVAFAVRDRMVDAMLQTEEKYRKRDAKRVYYFSIEYLVGRSLAMNLRNLGMYNECREALTRLGSDLQDIEECEPDAALGNGGLGRLAACFLDSLATLGMPGYGYGINYEYGLFKQEIDSGYQRELPDNWLARGSPWQIARPDQACMVPIYGRIEHGIDRHGAYNPMWMDWKLLIGVPYDMLIPGYGGHTVNFLRLFSARSSHEFDMRIFNDGDYFKAVEQKIQSENISKVLYPSDAVIASQELRLAQEYFLVACAVRDVVRRFQQSHAAFSEFPSKVAVQLNDTHPVLAIVELMRILVDEKDLSWDEAWDITQKTFAYTNHTLSNEALEKWPVPLLEHVLPRHLQIVYEINRRFLEHVASTHPENAPRIAQSSLIEESQPKRVRMLNLAVVGSHSVNGVSAIHSELVKTRLAPQFHELFPEKFNNKTNGISQRRWLLNANPMLSDLICSTIGDRWISSLPELQALQPYASDSAFGSAFLDVRRANKQKLAALIHESLRLAVDPESLFDVQIKRIHGYKRQLLNVMHIIHDYLAILEGRASMVARTYVFAGKAAPGYWLAKQIIKLIHNVANVINSDPRASGLMKVVFLPDYRVSLAEKIIPAADVSEQISTAGTEASGTGNMKMALNGAVTIGTFDGANLEIMHEVGDENIFLFGAKASQLQKLRNENTYNPYDYCERHPRLKMVVESLRSNLFCPHEPGIFSGIYRSLLVEHDEYFHLLDCPAYLSAQDEIGRAYCDRERWARMSILNVARAGRFSSDRTISEYAGEIWHINPCQQF